MKRTPLKRKTPLRRGGPLRATSAKRNARDRQYRKVRHWVADRSSGLCEAQLTDVCAIRGVHAHHVLPRSAGGPDEPSNLLWLCAPCHLWVHEHPAASYERGLLRRRSA